MSSRWLPMWFPAIGIAACGVGGLLQTPAEHCAGGAWLCNTSGMLIDLGMMAAPLLLLLARGVFAGARQVRRTRTMVRAMLALPPRPLPTPIAGLVQRLDLEQRVQLVDCVAPQAFCYGFLRPRICLTTGLLAALSLDEVEAVLRHERHHLRRGDPLRTLLWTMASSALWWLEEHARHADLLRELAADQAVIREQGRAHLAGALLKLLRAPNRSTHAHHDLAVSGLSVTEARIDQLTQRGELVMPAMPIRHWLVLPLLMLLTVMICSLVMAHIWI